MRCLLTFPVPVQMTVCNEGFCAGLTNIYCRESTGNFDSELIGYLHKRILHHCKDIGEQVNSYFIEFSPKRINKEKTVFK